MWYGEVTPELVDAAKRYGAIFNMSPECYSQIIYEDFELDEFIALIELSIEKKTELPTTLNNLLGPIKFKEINPGL